MSRLHSSADSAAPALPARLLSWTGGLAAAGLLGWGLADGRFRYADGMLNGGFALVVSLAGAVLALAFAGRLGRAAGWLALSIAGQAIALQTIDAGRLIHYQHYRSLAELLAAYPLHLAFLTVQAVIVLAGLRRHAGRLWAWLRKSFRWWQLGGLALVFILPAAALSREPAVYAAELAFAVVVQAVQLGSLTLIVLALPPEFIRAFERAWGRLLASAAEPIRLERFAWLAAAWVSVVSALLSYFIYQNHPHVPDEVIYVYQARYLAEGRLTIPAYPLPEAFSIYMVPFKDAVWYSPFSPGWPALLALGVRLGAAWLVNPLLAAANILLTYLLVGRLAGRPFARLVVLLLCLSPWYIFMSMNLMAHTLQTTCLLLGALGVERARGGHWGWAGLAGAAAGYLSLIRPLDGLLVAGLLGLWAIGLGGKRLKWAAIGVYILAGTLVGGLTLPYNAALTGSALTLPLEDFYTRYYGPGTYALGFGPDRGIAWDIDAFPGYTPLEAVINSALNAFSVNVELFGWGFGSLLLAGVLVLSWKPARLDWLMLALTAAMVAFYALFWYSGGPDFGARYWYLAIIPLVILSVRGLQRLSEQLSGAAAHPLGIHPRLAAALVIVSLIAAVNYLPWRAFDKYYQYLNMRPDLPRLVQELGFGGSLVIIQGQSHPDYASAWVYNPLDPYAPEAAGAPIYVYEVGPETRAQAEAAFPGRPVWVLRGPSLSGAGYEVVERPGR
jgi:hypothetical protein